MRSRTFKAAIFDMDGLLIDSERAIAVAWLAAAKSLGFALELHDFAQVIGRAALEGDAILAGLLGSEKAVRETAVRVRAALMQDGKPPVFPLKPGVVALLQSLRDAGVPCAVASSSRVQEIRHRLGKTDVLKYFQSVTGGDEVERGKPDPAIYRLAALRLKTAPQDCIAFEDSENGARAAQAADIRVVIVPDLRRPGDEVIAGAHGVIESLHEAVVHVPYWFPARADEAV